MIRAKNKAKRIDQEKARHFIYGKAILKLARGLLRELQ
jgi:hypothetical protein